MVPEAVDATLNSLCLGLIGLNRHNLLRDTELFETLGGLLI